MKALLNITDTCNLNCSYCYRLTKESSRTVTQEQLEKNVDFLVKEAQKSGDSKMILTFFGGEPLLFPEKVFSCIDYCYKTHKDMAFTFAVDTNGTTLTKELVKQLKENRVEILLSLDGGSDTHDANRVFHDGSGSFETILPALKYLDKKSITVEKVIRVNTVAQTADAYKSLVELGFKRFVFAVDFGDEWDDESFELLTKEYEKIAEMHLENHTKKRDVLFNLFDDKINGHLYGGSMKERACAIGVGHFALSTEGLIFPCSRFISNDPNNEFCLGSVDEGFRESLCSMLKKYHAEDHTSCGNCSIKDRCLGNSCGCISFSTTGDLFGVSPLVCEHERMVTRIADRIGAKLYQ